MCLKEIWHELDRVDRERAPAGATAPATPESKLSAPGEREPAAAPEAPEPVPA